MCIRDLIEQFEIQGMYHIKVWKDDDYETLAQGEYFEFDKCEIDEEILNREIIYMYAVDRVLNIEVEDK